ncbi:hypothetical protein DPMN_040432 [Dreissena polymorpha]|uniref:Uncharacterized protein n=1 Tax=Dreissena polymorpha TaxID=45954 RepID=A0A9D4CV10_DREPO|nr:hypothetical protein DPMN_040432 [Dreissena polymorpha]
MKSCVEWDVYKKIFDITVYDFDIDPDELLATAKFSQGISKMSSPAKSRTLQFSPQKVKLGMSRDSPTVKEPQRLRTPDRGCPYERPERERDITRPIPRNRAPAGERDITRPIPRNRTPAGERDITCPIPRSRTP